MNYPDGNRNTHLGIRLGDADPAVSGAAATLRELCNFDLPCWAPDNVTTARTKLSVFCARLRGAVRRVRPSHIRQRQRRRTG